MTQAPVPPSEVTYACYSCERDVVIKRGGVNEDGDEAKSDQMRCRECGCRMLYKKRTKRVVQFEAR
jgi:DNA-directed RNA polymerase subunit RPC12/RpoP